MFRCVFGMAVALGNYFSIILTEDGSIFGVGRNDTCALGCNDNVDRDTPVLISLNKWSDDTAVMVSAGSNHSACVTAKGMLYVWGSNTHGQLGLAPDDEMMHIAKPKIVELYVDGVSSRPPATMVACGENFTALLTADGCVWTSGSGTMGELGHEVLVDFKPIFTKIPSSRFNDKLISMVAIGAAHCIALDMGVTAELWSWGSNAFGQLGLGDNVFRSLPQKLESHGEVLSSVAASGNISAALGNGKLWVCGHGIYGALGLHTYGNLQVMTSVGLGGVFGDGGVKHVAIGWHHMIALTEDNRLFSWGLGSWAQLAQVYMVSSNKPIEVKLKLNEGDSVKLVAAGFRHQAIVTNHGILYTWGTWRNVAARRELCELMPGVTKPHSEQAPVKTPFADFVSQRAGRWHVPRNFHFNTFAMGTHARSADYESSPLGRVGSPVAIMNTDALSRIHAELNRPVFQPSIHCGNGLRALMGFGPK